VSVPPSFPELSADVIERKAADLLSEYYRGSGRAEKLPVPVEVIAEQHLGYDIDIVDDGLFSDPDYLGGIIFDRKLIQVNATVEAHEGRYNFTLAHEIGHHVLHRDIYLAARDGKHCEVMCRETGEKPLIEVQADRSAAALLMPADAVARIVDQQHASTEAKSVAALRGIASSIIKAGNFTNVSNTAMVNRLIDLGYASGASYQSGTGHDFARSSGYRIRQSLPLAVQHLLWRLYSKLRQRRRKPRKSRSR